MPLSAAASTHVGQRRKANEDSFALCLDAGLVAVADGMGGHKAGQVASDLAARAVEASARAAYDDSSVAPDVLGRAFEEANRQIFSLAQQNDDLAGMGTTLVALLLRGERLALAHVGDSRAYCLRDGTLRRLTHDHSLVGELQRREQISDEAAREHPHRHVLTRAVGVRRRVQFEALELVPADGDLFLLCSDGLTGHVLDEELAAALAVRDLDLQAACDGLVALANERGGLDNITVLIARYAAG